MPTTLTERESSPSAVVAARDVAPGNGSGDSARTRSPENATWAAPATRLRTILGFSVGFACTGAVVATVVAPITGASWIWTFAVARWLGIIGMIIAIGAARVLGADRLIPRALQTPVTILVLMTESVLVDIASARLL